MAFAGKGRQAIVRKDSQFPPREDWPRRADGGEQARGHAVTEPARES